MPDVSEQTLPESRDTEHLQRLLYLTGRAGAQQQGIRTQRRTWQPGGPGKKRLIISPTFRSKVQWKDNLWKLLLKARDALWGEESVNPSGRSCLVWMHVVRVAMFSVGLGSRSSGNFLQKPGAAVNFPANYSDSGWKRSAAVKLDKWGLSGSGNSLQT